MSYLVLILDPLAASIVKAINKGCQIYLSVPTL